MKLQHLNKFLNHWGDTKSKQRLFNSEKGIEAQKADIENQLKDMAMRFERSPQPNTIRLWASDIVDAGFNESVVREALKTVPFKFEKHPTLAQVMELLRPYLPHISVLEDELDKYSRLAYMPLKEEFLKLLTQDQLTQMTLIYERKIFPDLKSFNQQNKEMCVLFDWLRCHRGNGEKILAQGMRSNEEHIKGNREYFLHPLRQYCKSLNL